MHQRCTCMGRFDGEVTHALYGLSRSGELICSGVGHKATHRRRQSIVKSSHHGDWILPFLARKEAYILLFGQTASLISPPLCFHLVVMQFMCSVTGTRCKKNSVEARKHIHSHPSSFLPLYANRARSTENRKEKERQRKGETNTPIHTRSPMNALFCIQQCKKDQRPPRIQREKPDVWLI